MVKEGSSEPENSSGGTENGKNQKPRQSRALKAFEEVHRAVIELRDESDIGAEVIAQSEIAQRIINRGWDFDKLKHGDILVLQGALAGLQTEIADTKHARHEANYERFKTLYDILWRKYGDPERWKLNYEGEGAAFRHRAVTLRFGYDEFSFIMCIIVMKYLSECSDKFDAAIQKKSKNGVTTPSINSEIALKKVSREWREKILSFLGLKTTDLS